MCGFVALPITPFLAMVQLAGARRSNWTMRALPARLQALDVEAHPRWTSRRGMGPQALSAPIPGDFCRLPSFAAGPLAYCRGNAGRPFRGSGLGRENAAPLLRKLRAAPSCAWLPFAAKAGSSLALVQEALAPPCGGGARHLAT